jgi:type IV pilus assembly protein PilE
MNRKRNAAQRTQGRGVTLIELMIVVVVVAILAAVAYPSYRNYLIQMRRSDAQIALTEIANREEKFLLQCPQYTDVVAGGSIAACTGLNYANLSPDRHYALSVALTASNQQFTATADPNGAGVTALQNNNGSLRIDSAGVKGWNKNNTGTWLSWTAK